MLTTEQLLAPRYKVIADYPSMPMKIGDIISETSPDYQLFYLFKSIDTLSGLDKFPGIFKKLEWWQERKPEDMPAYIKYWDTSYYFPIDRVCELAGAPFEATGFTASNFLPATEAEYLAQNETGALAD